MPEVTTTSIIGAAVKNAPGIWALAQRAKSRFRFVRTNRDSLLGYGRSIRLTDAAQIARDALVEYAHGRYAEGLAKDGDALSWYMHALAMPDTADSYKFPGPLRLFGKRYQSTRTVEVPLKVRTSTYLARDDAHGTSLKESSRNVPPAFVDLEILRDEMWKRIEDMKVYGRDDGIL